MTQILSRFFKGILFQLWVLKKTETKDTKWNTSNSAPSQSQAQHTQGWQKDTGDLLPGGFFRLVGCFFGSSSYCNDPLPAPAVNFLCFYMKKASKIQTTCWMAKALPPCIWLPPETQRIRTKLKLWPPLLTTYIRRWLIYSISNPACCPSIPQKPSP